MASLDDYNEILRRLDFLSSEYKPTYPDNPQELVRELIPTRMNFEPPVMMAGYPEGARTIYVTPVSRDEATETNVPKGFERAARYALSPTPIRPIPATTDGSSDFLTNLALSFGNEAPTSIVNAGSQPDNFIPNLPVSALRDSYAMITPDSVARDDNPMNTLRNLSLRGLWDSFMPTPLVSTLERERRAAIAAENNPYNGQAYMRPISEAEFNWAHSLYNPALSSNGAEYVANVLAGFGNDTIGTFANIGNTANDYFVRGVSPLVAGVDYLAGKGDYGDLFNYWSNYTSSRYPIDGQPIASPQAMLEAIGGATVAAPLATAAFKGIPTVGRWIAGPTVATVTPKVRNVNLERFVDNIADDIAFRGDTSGILPWSLRGTGDYKILGVVEPPSWTGRPAIIGDVTDETLTKLALGATPDPTSNIPNNIRLLTDTGIGNSLSDLVKLGLSFSGARAAGEHMGENIDQAIANANEAKARREQAQKDGANIAEILDSKNASSASSQPSRFSPTAQTSGSPQSSSFPSQAVQSLNPSQLSSLGLPQSSLSGYTPYTLDFETAINNPYSPLYGLQPNADNNLMSVEEALNYDPKIDEWYTNLKAKLNIIPREELIGLEAPVNLKPFIDEAGKGFGIKELKSDKEVEDLNNLIFKDFNGLDNWLSANVSTPILDEVRATRKAYEEGRLNALTAFNNLNRQLTSAENEAADNYSDSFWSWLALILTIPFSIRRGISPMETWDKIITSRVNLNNRVRELRSARDAQIENLNAARTAFTDYTRLAPSLIEFESRQTLNPNNRANALNAWANYIRALNERNPSLTPVDQARIEESKAKAAEYAARAGWWANRPYPAETSDNAFDKAMNTLYPIYLYKPDALPLETRRQIEAWVNSLYSTSINPSIFYNENTNPTYQILDSQQPR